MTLKSTTVVVLGGSSGIGLATARAAAAEGATVIITGRSAERLAAARDALGGAVSTHVLDAADEAGTRDLFASLPGLDHLFITAGQLALDSKLAPAVDALRPAMDTRFWGAIYAAKYAAPKMPSNSGVSV